MLKQLLPYINKCRDSNFLFVVPDFILQDLRDSNIKIWDDIAACKGLGTGCMVCLNFGWDEATDDPITRESFQKKLPRIGAAELELRALLSQSFRSYNPSQSSRVLSGSWLLAAPKGVIKGTDLGLWGKLRSVAREAIAWNLDDGDILLISNTAPDKSGQVYALDGHDMSLEVASQTSVDKVILYIEDLPAEYKGKALDLTEAQALTATKSSAKLPPPLAELLRQAIAYAAAGIKRVHIIPAKEDGALFKEILTSDGCGLMLNIDSYEQLTFAEDSDVNAIKALISPWEERGVLRPRTPDELLANIDNFCIIKKDEAIIGCAAVSPMSSPPGHAELECVVVHDAYRNQGYGARLVNSMEKHALSKGYKKLVIFSTQTASWFEEMGYKPTKDKIPPPDYCRARNSRVLVKPLSAKGKKIARL